MHWGQLTGVRVTLSEYLTEAGEPVTVRRTWSQRLLSRPWRPWQATYTYTPQVPYRGALTLPGGGLVMHPETWRQMKEKMR